ncbi:hypothetical protein GCM10010252_12410 [Streptomyces aureoverticillatus]|nr:hypothetical protein GCM10010252_12410 [Streptomyces aureoverticillatus]
MTSDAAARAVTNEIHDGVSFSTVVQGQLIAMQLPPTVVPALGGLRTGSRSFTGRRQELTDLLAGLAPDADAELTPVSLVTGLGGIGKTELVVQVAELALARPGWFLGGVLFIDLFGYDSRRCLAPESALGSLLNALGISEGLVPPGVQDRSRLYRSVLAAYAERGRRILVVLDNAATAGQVRPLLPGDRCCRTLVTSRDTLDLDTRLHDLNVLSPEEGVVLLGRALRQARGAADTRADHEPAAAHEISALCGHLPLALRIAAAILADTPNRPLSSLAHALREAHARLDSLSREDGVAPLRAAFELSYRRLSDNAATMFRRLALNPGHDLSTEVAACLADTTAEKAERQLLSLVRAHLLESGPAWGRWRFHDLVRVYADELASADPSSPGARDRMLEHYSERARAAGTYSLDLLYKTPHGFTDRQEAMTWLEVERPNLLAAVTQAAGARRHDVACDISAAITNYLKHHGYYDELVASSETAVRAARAASDTERLRRALVHAAFAANTNDDCERALPAADEAVGLYRASGGQAGRGQAHRAQADTLFHVGRAEEAFRSYEQAADLLREATDRDDEETGFHPRHLLGCCLLNHGAALGDAGRCSEAIAILQEAVNILERTSRSVGGLAELNLGEALERTGRLDLAVAAYRSAARKCQEAQDRWGAIHEADALERLGSALAATQRPLAAIEAMAQAADRYRALGMQALEATTLRRQAGLLADQEAYAQACACARRVVDLLQALADEDPAEYEEQLAEARSGLAALQSLAADSGGQHPH